MRYNAKQIAASGVASVWGDVAFYLKSALEYTAGRLTLSELREMLDAGDMQLWIVERDERTVAALVTELAQYPSKRVLSLSLYGGEEVVGALPLLSLLEAWAEKHGCDQVEIQGRKGWGKLTGWPELSRVFVKELKAPPSLIEVAHG